MLDVVGLVGKVDLHSGHDSLDVLIALQVVNPEAGILRH